MTSAPQGQDHPVMGQAGDGARYEVDARGAHGLMVGDQGTQINYFYKGTWSDGVAPPPLVGVSGTITSPYRGLSAFGERDAALFFGRESAATRVLELMSRCLDGTALMVVSGVSGAGKSSLLRAGVLPRLRGAGIGSVPEAAWWPCLVFAPGSRPLEELAVRLAPLAGTDAASIVPGLTADPGGFALTARQAAVARLSGPAPGAGGPDGGGQPRVLLVVDQFEQLFTRCENEGERQAFITALHAAAARAGGDHDVPPAVVVLVVRADFEARLGDYPLLASPVQDRYLLTAMTGRQLRMAITQPAVIAGSRVEDDLVQVLLEEVRTRSGSPAAGPDRAAISAGVLPLLSHALDQAWRGRTGQALTLADYERAGGIEGAVAGSAQRAYGRLTPARQDMARQVFTALTATTSDGVDIAARATRADLTTDMDDARIRDVEAVLETFTAERLLTLAAGTVEISHEVLLTAWPMLRDTWLADTHADRVVRTRVQATAEEWNKAARDPAYLYTGSRLEIAAETAARIGADARQTPLGRAEQDFLRASRRASRRQIRRRQGVTAVLLALVAGLAAVAVAAVRAGQASAYQRDVAVSRELVSSSQAVGDTNASVSKLESIAAWGIDHSPQASYVMLTAAASPQIATLTGGSGPVVSVAFSPDGTTLATGNADDTARLWKLATGKQTASVPVGSNAAWPVAFSPDGTTLATGGEDGTARLWNIATGRQARTLNTGSAQVWSVAFSPDGTTLATGGGDGTARLWNIATGRLINSLPTGAGSINAVAFSPDGTTLATGGGDGTARLWNVATGQQITRFRADATSVHAVAFSLDGKTLATGGDGGTALWDRVTGRQIGTTFPGFGGAESVAFSPDGTTLATGNADGTIRLWNLATSRQIGTSLSNAKISGRSVAFSPDGTTLATGSDDGTARLWNVPTGRQIRTLNTGSAQVWSVAFSPDGTTLATGSDDGTIRLWNVPTGRQIRTLNTGWPGPNSVTFSPDGKTLATGGGPDAWLWNVATGKQIRILNTASAGVWSAAFSPDGTTLATGSAGGVSAGTTRLWDVATGKQIRTLDTGLPGVSSVAFSPDGKTLATGEDNSTARLWNVATGQQIGSPLITNGFGQAVAFSPDGKTLATGGGTVAWLWNVATGQKIGSSLTTPGTGWSVAFSPDGKTLATGDGPVTLWNVGYLVDPLSRVCSQVGGSLTRAEWAQFVPPGPPYRDVCAQHF